MQLHVCTYKFSIDLSCIVVLVIGNVIIIKVHVFSPRFCIKIYDLWVYDFLYDFQASFVAKGYSALDLWALLERELFDATSMTRILHFTYDVSMGYGFMLFKRRCTDKTWILPKTFMSRPQNFV